MKYKLFIERAAQKELSKIPHREQDRIITAIKNLTDNPRPSNVKKLGLVLTSAKMQKNGVPVAV